MKILSTVMISTLFIGSLSVVSAAEHQPKSKEEIRAERAKELERQQAEEHARIARGEKEMAIHKEKLAVRCPEQIPMTKMMEIKNKGSAEIDGYHYYPYNTVEFNKNAPSSVQFLTHKENATLSDTSIGDKGVWVCKYTYKTFSGYSYNLDLVFAGLQVK